MKKIFSSLWQRRVQAMLLVLVVILGLACKYVPALGEWVRDYLNGVFYVLAWTFLLSFLLPACHARCASLSATLLTCILEFLQLWHPPWLEALREITIGRLILGSSFAWDDFPFYFVGGLLGWLALRALHKLQA